ncbi:MAG: GYD domain-containing protein [Chloroflexi bacterium]|nr:GYD domain-containing protein [Chloroflexota bacterium]
MPKYLMQVTYSDDALADLVRHPEDRAAVISELVERLGGRVEAFHHSLGEYDLVIIAEFPDNETVAALQIAVRSTGVLKDQKITALLSREEAVNALKRAGSSGYQPPS